MPRPPTSPSPTRARRSTGFTLVELLVVIGIIALLISILLPTLNSARQSANSVDCLSRLRQMGAGVALYTNANNGALPFGFGPSTDAPVPPSTIPPATTWDLLISNAIEPGTGNSVADFAKASDTRSRELYVDKDTARVTNADTGYIHYSCHPRLMPHLQLYPTDPAPGIGAAKGYKISQIKRNSEIVLIMDGVQGITNNPEQQGKCFPVAAKLDNSAFGVGGSPTKPADPTNLLADQLDGEPADYRFGDSIDGGSNELATGLFADPQWGNIEWRHKNRGEANFLFVDGHAEGRYYKSARNTGLLRKNVHIDRL